MRLTRRLAFPQLPETKNRTFEEIAALFRPIQYNAGGAAAGAAAFPDYGCSLANMELPKAQATLASPSTPANGGHLLTALGGQRIVSSGGTLDGAGATLSKSSQRFRFDSTATGSFMAQASSQADHHQHGALNHSNSLSQGNLYNHSNMQHTHFIPHTSCTSIQTQNLSTNDQQPLIVEAQNDLHYHHNHRHHHHSHSHNQNFSYTLPSGAMSTCLHNNHQTKQQTPVPTSLHRCNHIETTTTSFMGNNNNDRRASSTIHKHAQNDVDGPNDDGDDDDCVFCCEPNVKFSGCAGSGALLHEHSQTLRSLVPFDGDVCDGKQIKAGTLTRTYKPLNDLEVIANSTVDDSNYTDTATRRRYNHL